MGWFRSNTGRVAWLAFFALACQLVLSFGHRHLGNPNAGAAWAVLADAGKPTEQAPPAIPPSPVGVADEYCAVCASITLASLLLLPVVLALLAPISFLSRLPNPEAETRPASIAHFLFDARGPPAA
jgi:hypothetical protein